MERIANPKDFAGRSLVLWNADYMHYGIVYRVVKQCCIKFDKENPDEQVWFKTSDFMFYNEDYTQSKALPDLNETEVEYGYKRFGILLNTGCYGLQVQDEWFKFVKTHTNRCGHIFQDCAVIVCAQADDIGYFGKSNPKFILKEDQFAENCDIYSIQPTLDEWTTWVAQFCNPEVLKVVHAFIEKKGLTTSFDYWQRIMVELERHMRYEDCSLFQLPKEDVELAVFSNVSTSSPASEFCDFIYEFKPIE